MVKFKVVGNLRYLSHAEMLRVFHRACVRAGIELQYSRGFNPRARLSLPLPKSVGVEGDEELLCLRVPCGCGAGGQEDHLGCGFGAEALKSRLSVELPEGCSVLSASVKRARCSFEPAKATYLISVRREYLDEVLRARAAGVLAGERLLVRRKKGDEGGRIKDVDVRGFLRSIETDEQGLVVECGVGAGGSIRVEEILTLLGLDAQKLDGPVRRTKIEWRES